MKLQITILILLIVWGIAPIIMGKPTGQPVDELEIVLDQIDQQSQALWQQNDSSVVQSGKEIVAMLDYLIFMAKQRESQEDFAENGSESDSGSDSASGKEGESSSGEGEGEGEGTESETKEGDRGGKNKNADHNDQSGSQDNTKELGEGGSNQSDAGNQSPSDHSSGDSPSESPGGGLAPSGERGTGRVREQKFDTNVAWWELPPIIREKNAPPTINQLPQKYRKRIENYYLKMIQDNG